MPSGPRARTAGGGEAAIGLTSNSLYNETFCIQDLFSSTDFGNLIVTGLGAVFFAFPVC